MQNLKPVFLLFSLLISVTVYSQTLTPAQDCINATIVCSPIIQVTGPVTGYGNITDIYPDISCQPYGEMNSSWYKIYVPYDGVLNFSIIPTNLSDDFDWAVYNITNAQCSDINGNYNLLEECNSSGVENNNGITGANNYLNGSQGAPAIWADKESVYVILITGYNTTAGYTIDFSNSDFLIDNNPIGFNHSKQPVKCSTNELVFFLDHMVECTSISTSDFTLHTIGGQNVQVNNVQPVTCSADGFSSTLKMSTIWPLDENQQYVLQKTGSLNSSCNSDASVDTMHFSLAAFHISDISVTRNGCLGYTLFPIMDTIPQGTYTWVFPNNGYDDWIYANAPGDTGIYTFKIIMFGCTVATYEKHLDTLVKHEPVALSFQNDTFYANPPLFNRYTWTISRNTHHQVIVSYPPQNYILYSQIQPNLIGPSTTVSVEASYDTLINNCEFWDVYSFMSNSVETIESNPIKLNTLVIDKLQIRSDKILTGTFSITNMLGQDITTLRVENATNAELNVSNFAPGMYVLTFTNGKRNFSTKILKVEY